MAIAIATAYCLFVIWRVVKAPAVPVAGTGGFSPMTAQAPLPVELAFSAEDERR
ncbi:hypothetical protein D3C83_170820 [compost metagenome]